MQQFGHESPSRHRAADAPETFVDEVPTVKMRKAEALPEASERAGEKPAVTPKPGVATT